MYSNHVWPPKNAKVYSAYSVKSVKYFASSVTGYTLTRAARWKGFGLGVEIISTPRCEKIVIKAHILVPIALKI